MKKKEVSYLFLGTISELDKLMQREQKGELRQELGIENDAEISYMSKKYFLNLLNMNQIKNKDTLKVFFPSKYYSAEVKEKLEEEWINYQTIDDLLVESIILALQ